MHRSDIWGYSAAVPVSFAPLEPDAAGSSTRSPRCLQDFTQHGSAYVQTDSPISLLCGLLLTQAHRKAKANTPDADKSFTALRGD